MLVAPPRLKFANRRRGLKTWSTTKARSRRANMARLASRLARRNVVSNLRIGGFRDLEVKFLDSAIADTQIPSPTDASSGELDPTGSCLNAIAQGDGESNRDGRKVTLHSVFINGTVSTDTASDQTTATISGSQVFVALVLDTQTNGAQLSSENVFTNPGASAFTAASPLRNLQYLQRFKVLATKVIDMNPDTLTYDGTADQKDSAGKVRSFRIYKRLKIPVIYTNTTASIANVADNSLHVIAFASGRWTCNLSYNARIRFTG